MIHFQIHCISVYPKHPKSINNNRTSILRRESLLDVTEAELSATAVDAASRKRFAVLFLGFAYSLKIRWRGSRSITINHVVAIE